MRCLVIDGFHARQVFDFPQCIPTIRIPVQKIITFCDCYSESPSDNVESKPTIKEYKLLWSDSDKGTAVYSSDGDLFEHLIKGRDWVIDRERQLWHKSPIYVSCRDERAFGPEDES